MEWLSKKTCRSLSDADVAVSKSQINGKDYINFRFLEKILPNVSRTGYVRIAIDGTRLYFDESDSRDGWKLQVTRGCSNSYLRIKNEGRINKVAEEGSYDLKFDVVSGYYYIDFNEKLEKKKIIWEKR